MKKGFRLSYNAPVVLTFSLISLFILVLDMKFFFNGKLIPALFMVPGAKNASVTFDWTSVINYVRIFTHVLGHGDWTHLLGNLSFILLVGPLMEEKYGSPAIAVMMIITAFVTGVINACFLPASLYGASGIAFMFILLAAISTINKNELPVSFFFILAVFIAREAVSPSSSNISTIAHIAGGLCGSLFGFFTAPKSEKVEKITVSKNSKKSKTKPLTAKEKLERLKAINAASPRNSSDDKTVVSRRTSALSDDDKTVEIGTIKL